ncbi:MAG: pH-response regulator protein palA/rim20 [Phylliscum demangeonii]|nr:MAG: pH-response regulator protein palA/rim20 [Phylliscum demangeonii]
MASFVFIPFRGTHPVSLAAGIRQYISTKYVQEPDDFSADLDAIDHLRTDAIKVLEPHPSGIRKIMAYAAQLIGVEFVWYPALGYHTEKPVSQNNLRFEFANIVYNLAALYSQLGFSRNRTSSDGLKSTCNYFCQAAGVIQHLKDHVVQEMRSVPPEDMDTVTLEGLEQLLLGQAQECFWQKAVVDGLKDASISKLAASVSDYYSTAGDSALKSDSISSEWIHHLTAKHHHFAAAAQFRAACDCSEKRKYGEEVARLRDSLSCVNEALREGRYLNKIVLGDLHLLKNRIQEHLKRAEKDNDIIYLHPVSSKSELKLLDRANMVTAKVPQELSQAENMIGDHGKLGSPLFSKLVPYSVHVAAGIYAERRDRLVNHSIIEELGDLTIQLHELLQSLSLPGSVEAVEKPLGLPSGLLAHAQELRQAGGMHPPHRLTAEIAKVKSSDRVTYGEGVSLLDHEAAEDERTRTKYGTDRWTRPYSQEAGEKLWTQAAEIEGYFTSAHQSDQLVETKVESVEHLISLLAGDPQELEDNVPSSRRVTLAPRLVREVGALRSVLNEVDTLELARRTKADAVKRKAESDDLSRIILREAARLEREFPMQRLEPAHFENFFDQQLQKYEDALEMVSKERERQGEVAARLRDANAAFVDAKKGESSSREREQALQNLENAYYKYKEIMSNLDVGRKFYTDLARIVDRFRDDCKEFVYQRRSEATQLLK